MTSILSNPAIVYTVITIIVSVIIVVLVYDRYIRKYIKVNIMRKFGTSTYKVIKVMKKKLHETELRFKGKIYIIDLTKAVLDKRNRPVLYYDEEEAQPKSLIDNKIFVESDIVESFVTSKMFKLMFGTGKVDKVYMLMLVICVIGIVVIAIFSIWKIAELNSVIANLKNPPTNSTIIEPVLPPV